MIGIDPTIANKITEIIGMSIGGSALTWGMFIALLIILFVIKEEVF